MVFQGIRTPCLPLDLPMLKTCINPYPVSFVSLKKVYTHYLCCIDSNALQTTFSMAASSMNLIRPLLWEHSDFGPYCEWTLILTLYLLVSSAENFCKQFGSRSGPTKHRAWSESKLFDTLIEFLIKVDFEKISRQQKAGKNPRGQRVQHTGEKHYIRNFGSKKNVVKNRILQKRSLIHECVFNAI